jgi:hypothetical protein
MNRCVAAAVERNRRAMVDVHNVTSEEMRRRVLLEEGVFRGVATASAALLDMFWKAREGDEYRAISIRIEDIPSLIVCHRCGGSGPGVDQLIATITTPPIWQIKWAA